ncbi:MAG: methylenetetrahydrofolate--tRNA-(uracil(54)-C(5))-methyltransferase (FADH(2)-oxidizing) TrmFO [Candidatus Xenobia bacterium]
MSEQVVVVGGGLAGSEAAWQVAQRGVPVRLYEMRPERPTEVHRTDWLAEIVCSNSFGTSIPTKAPGLLKAELRRLGSLLIRIADETQVPAGQALAVDRERFAQRVQESLAAHPLITIVREEVREVPTQRPAIVASGPLTSEPLAQSLLGMLGQEYLYFYDAASPIVAAESLDESRVFAASRYGKSGDDYLNCPLDEPQYQAFWEALSQAETVTFKAFEKPRFFEGCMPIEELAARGRDTLRFGPMKPVGLTDPQTGRQAYAVLQLRAENRERTMYNLVGFQTRMKWGEQRRVLRMIPGLSNAEFHRYGVMHRNIFINSPTHLAASTALKAHPGLFLAGCIVGSEGYMECVGTGLLAAVNAVRHRRGEAPVELPRETALGALMHYLTTSQASTFQPMNVNFGLLPPLEGRIRDREQRNQAFAERAATKLSEWLDQHPEFAGTDPQATTLGMTPVSSPVTPDGVK